MTGRMDWRRARLVGKRVLDYRFEDDVPDRAARWLRKVESRQQAQRRQRQRGRRTLTASSSAIAIRFARKS
jgi:hypothetical protein